jgi:hypothetical protein
VSGVPRAVIPQDGKPYIRDKMAMMKEIACQRRVDAMLFATA